MIQSHTQLPLLEIELDFLAIASASLSRQPILLNGKSLDQKI